MKIIFGLAILLLSFGANAQWSAVYPEKNTTLGIQRNGNNFFWVDNVNKLHSSSYGEIMELVPAGPAMVTSFFISFSDEANGLLTISYFITVSARRAVFQTMDSGRTWTDVTSIFPDNMSPAFVSGRSFALNDSFWLCEQFDDVLQGGISQGNVLWMSRDKGKSWSAFTRNSDSFFSVLWSNSMEFVISPSRNYMDSTHCLIRVNSATMASDTLFFDRANLLKSDTQFYSYYILDEILNDATGKWCILFHEYIPSCGALYNSSVLIKSVDNGKTWSATKFKLEKDIYEAPSNLLTYGSIMYIASGQEVYKSEDGGKSWEKHTGTIRKSSTDYSVITMMFLSGDILFAGTNKAALWAHSAIVADISLREKNIEKEEQSLFPNPVETGGIIYLNSGLKSESPLQIRLYSGNGKLVTTSTTSDGQFTLPILSSGIYFIQTASEKGKCITQKITIK